MATYYPAHPCCLVKVLEGHHILRFSLSEDIKKPILPASCLGRKQNEHISEGMLVPGQPKGLTTAVATRETRAQESALWYLAKDRRTEIFPSFSLDLLQAPALQQLHSSRGSDSQGMQGDEGSTIHRMGSNQDGEVQWTHQEHSGKGSLLGHSAAAPQTP